MVPIVERIHDETTEYFDRLLPGEMERAIAALMLELGAREAVNATFWFPEEWVLPAPQLAADEVHSDNGEATPEFDVPYTACLSPVSFERLQRTTRVLSDAIERYPAAFSLLSEDRISDLLAATLQATLPAANREVFSRGGKTDIFVHANVLSDGAEPAIVFIAESKTARSKTVIREALDPQLFSYLNSCDTPAVLLVLLSQKEKARAVDRYLKGLKEINSYLSDGPSPAAGWRILRYQRTGRILNLCVAMIHIPPF